MSAACYCHLRRCVRAHRCGRRSAAMLRPPPSAPAAYVAATIWSPRRLTPRECARCRAWTDAPTPKGIREMDTYYEAQRAPADRHRSRTCARARCCSGQTLRRHRFRRRAARKGALGSRSMPADRLLACRRRKVARTVRFVETAAWPSVVVQREQSLSPQSDRMRCLHGTA